VKTGPGQFSVIKQKVEEMLGDAAEMRKIAMEHALRALKPGQASRMGSAGRVGSRQGTVSE
jgi:hypothetical protein